VVMLWGWEGYLGPGLMDSNFYLQVGLNIAIE